MNRWSGTFFIRIKVNNAESVKIRPRDFLKVCGNGYIREQRAECGDLNVARF